MEKAGDPALLWGKCFLFPPFSMKSQKSTGWLYKNRYIQVIVLFRVRSHTYNISRIWKSTITSLTATFRDAIILLYFLILMDSQKVFHFTECAESSFRRTPVSSNIKGIPDAGVRLHDGKLRFPSFCASINFGIPCG